MLDYEKIKEFSAQKGVMDIIVEKDYILDWILWGISQHEYLRNRLVFKGGTALHKMLFSNWRFSEDLDFTTLGQVEKDELQEAIRKLCENIGKQSGIELRLRELISSGDEDSEWSFEVKIEYIGPRRQTGGNLPIILLHITNDELLIDRPIGKVLLTPYENLPTDFALLTYSLEEILAEKIRTVFHQRCWPRDIYDTWRLLREVGSFVDLEKVLNIYYRKSIYRGIKPGIPANIEERISRVENQWREGLQRQITVPPDFCNVYPEIKYLLEKIFKDYNVIKGGAKMLESNYVMRYKKGDLEIEVQGDKTFVEEKFKELFELKPLGTSKETVASLPLPSQEEATKKVSMAEFLKSKTPKSHGDKILVFGYYLEEIAGESSFNISDIERCYVQARIPKTKNFPHYIAQLTRSGYLMDAEEKKDNKKAWVLTDTGLRYVGDLASEKLTE